MKPGRGVFFWGVAAATAAAVPLYAFGVAGIARHGGWAQQYGWTAARDGAHWRVASVDPAGPAAGAIEPGDRVAAVNGDERAARLGPFYVLRVAPSVDAYTVRVEGPAGARETTLPLPRTWDARAFAATLTLLVGSLGFFLVGSAIGLLKPRDRMPQLLVTASLPAGLLLLGTALRPSSTFLRGLETLPYLALVSIYPWHYVLGFRFFNRFTSNDAPSRAWLAVERTLAAWGALVFVPRTVMAVLARPGDTAMLDRAWAHAGPFTAYARIAPLIEGAFAGTIMIAMCAVLAANYGRITELDQKRRLRWIVFGTAAGLLPLTMAVLARVIFTAAGAHALVEGPVFELVFRIANGLPVLIPLTLGYAVARHRVLGVSVVLRRGVQYLLATNVLRAVLVLPIAAFIWGVVSNPDRTVGELLFQPRSWPSLLLLAAATLSLSYRRALRDWVDRRFFREAYDQRRILLALIDRIGDCESMTDIAGLVAAEIGAALHPSSVHLCHLDPDRRGFTVGYSSGGGQLGAIDERDPLVQLVARRGSPVELTAELLAGLAPHERAWCDRLAADLVVPILAPDRHLVGLMILGAKRSEELYSPDDRRLLAAIASQVGVVHENLSLRARVDRDRRIRHEVIAHLDAGGISLLKECPTCGACYDSATEACDADGRELVLTLPVERRIDGRYRLDRLIGKGGMGAVYRATDLRLTRPVAVKVLVGALFGDRAAVRRFEREAQAVATLTHPNIVAVYDYGPTGADGAYLVMELLEGRTWRADLDRLGAATPQAASDLVDQVLDGLETAHGRGIVHRDLKPENLFLVARSNGPPLLKILDFGLAKTAGGEAAVTATATAPGMVLGTFGYMAPEMLVGQPADHRADVFALGVIVAETITGRRPFTGSTLPEVLLSVLKGGFHLDGDVRAIRRLDEVLQRCLAHDPAARYASAADLRRELVPALRACPPLGAPADVAPPTDVTPTLGRPRDPESR